MPIHLSQLTKTVNDDIYGGMVDDNIVQAMKNWYELGLEPGSFTEAVILRDYETAIFSAHHMINIRDHFYFADIFLAEEARVPNWKGYKNMTEDELSKIIHKEYYLQLVLNKIK
jgi:hypothetical protein